MNVSASATYKTPELPLPGVLHAWDSTTTSALLDQVDIGSFQPDKVFTRNNAEILTALATAAYAAPEDQEAHLDKQGAVRSFHFLDSANNEKLGIHAPDAGTQVSVVETDKALLVAARGTQPPWLGNLGKEDEFAWNDLGSDLDAVPVSNYDGSALVHEGFKRQADAIWDQLSPYLQTAIASHKEVHLAGHSLGAAVALELADRMHDQLGVLPESVMRMGGPDIGWGDEKKHLDQIGLSDHTINIVNGGDPVPLALPKGKAAGSEIYFDRNGAADTSGGSHVFDRVAIKASDIVTGHALIPMYRHFPQFYAAGLQDPANGSILDELGNRLNQA